jgi:hypothetical protein
MALSDRLAREIADVKAAQDVLEAKYQAEKAALQAKLQALKALKAAWSPALDTVFADCGMELKA